MSLMFVWLVNLTWSVPVLYVTHRCLIGQLDMVSARSFRHSSLFDWSTWHGQCPFFMSLIFVWLVNLTWSLPVLYVTHLCLIGQLDMVTARSLCHSSLFDWSTWHGHCPFFMSLIFVWLVNLTWPLPVLYVTHRCLIGQLDMVTARSLCHLSLFDWSTWHGHCPFFMSLIFVWLVNLTWSLPVLYVTYLCLIGQLDMVTARSLCHSSLFDWSTWHGQCPFFMSLIVVWLVNLTWSVPVLYVTHRCLIGQLDMVRVRSLCHSSLFDWSTWHGHCPFFMSLIFVWLVNLTWSVPVLYVTHRCLIGQLDMVRVRSLCHSSLFDWSTWHGHCPFFMSLIVVWLVNLTWSVPVLYVTHRCLIGQLDMVSARSLCHSSLFDWSTWHGHCPFFMSLIFVWLVNLTWSVPVLYVTHLCLIGQLDMVSARSFRHSSLFDWSTWHGQCPFFMSLIVVWLVNLTWSLPVLFVTHLCLIGQLDMVTARSLCHSSLFDWSTWHCQCPFFMSLIVVWLVNLTWSVPVLYVTHLCLIGQLDMVTARSLCHSSLFDWSTWHGHSRSLCHSSLFDWST